MAATANVLLPPEEKFWRRYSARHEFPLATALSIFAHGCVIGIFWLAYVLISQSDNDLRKPVSMDALMVDGGENGDGGLGGVPGSPGESRTELVQQKNFNENSATAPKATPNQQDDFLSPTPEFNSADPAELLKDLDLIKKEAEKNALKPDPNKKTAKSIEGPKMPGVGKGGNGGQGGDGGTGPKGVKGRVLDKREIFSFRWTFKVGDDTSAKERVEKLSAAGFAIVVTDNRGNYFFLKDLKRRPVELERKSLGPLKDALQWEIKSPKTINTLAREMQIKFEPQRIITFLPKAREEQLEAAESQYARNRGRDPQQIRATLFDFVLRDGVYEPTVIDQK